MFFSLNLLFAVANPLATIAATSSLPGLIPATLIAAISIVGLTSDSHRVHSALALFAVLGNVAIVVQFTLNPAASPFG